jgi:hypothetical protein
VAIIRSPLSTPANWTIPLNQSSIPNALSTDHLDSVVRRIDFEGDRRGNSATDLLNYTDYTISCYPRRAEYTIQQIFQNGLQTSEVSTRPTHGLVPLNVSITPPAAKADDKYYWSPVYWKIPGRFLIFVSFHLRDSLLHSEVDN